MKDGLKEGLLNKVKVTDKFWQGYQKLVIDTVIPYQEKKYVKLQKCVCVMRLKMVSR